jgi:hypothetical protein
MEKCLDYSRIHKDERNFDSMYFDITGDKNEDINQGFKYIITNDQIYHENFY